jgi:hypothetical protein
MWLKKLLIILFLFVSIIAHATTYYVATPANGGSNSNSGASNSPWATLSYACGQVPTGSHIIHVNAGSYSESSQCVLKVGVSIEGASMLTTTIVSSVGASALLNLVSASYYTAAQHISGIYFDGNSQNTYYALQSYGRSNLEIYNCTFINFARYGLRIFGNPQGYGESTSITYATGISIHDNIITNCAYYEHGIGGGADVYMACLEDPQIYNNTITQSRSLNGSGWNVNGCGIKTDGWTRGVHIYNNTLTGSPINDTENTTDSWDFAIEMWGDVGSITEGVHIHDNTIYNWYIDIAGRITRPGSYAFGCSIHDNIIGCASLPSVNKMGIWIEANTSVDGLYIYNNIIKNVAKGIYFYAGVAQACNFTNFYIYYNLIYNVGIDQSGFDDGNGITWSNRVGTANTVSNINIYNNVIAASTRSGSTQYDGISLMPSSAGTASTFNIKNNIITGFDHAPISTRISWLPGAGTISSLTVSNNIFYGNGNSNGLANSDGVALPSYSFSNNLTSNPSFVSTSDFHIQTGSPAIGSGIAVTLPTASVDYNGDAINNPPERGAYKYGTSGGITSPTVTTTTASSVTSSTVILGGTVTSDGGDANAIAGVCWGTSSNPTYPTGSYSYSYYTGHRTNPFTNTVSSGIISNTLYYYRAYVSNSAGIAYGNEYTFTTPHLNKTISANGHLLGDPVSGHILIIP